MVLQLHGHIQSILWASTMRVVVIKQIIKQSEYPKQIQRSVVCKDWNANGVSFNASEDTTKTPTMLVHSKKNQQYTFGTYLIQQMDILELPDVPGTKHRSRCAPTRHRWCTVNCSAPERLFEGLWMFSNKISTNTKHIDHQTATVKCETAKKQVTKECRVMWCIHKNCFILAKERGEKSVQK